MTEPLAIASALALYRTSGYSDIPVYGEFLGNPRSVCLGKDLVT